MIKRRNKLKPFLCPNCGADVPARALACPACGSDEETGWSEDTIYDGLDLPDSGDEPEPESAATRDVLWKVVAVVVLIAFGLVVLLGVW